MAGGVEGSASPGLKVPGSQSGSQCGRPGQGGAPGMVVCPPSPPTNTTQAPDKVEVGSSVTAVLRLLDGSGRDLPVSGRGDWSSSCSYYVYLLLLLLVVSNTCVPQHSTTWLCQWRPSLTWPRWRSSFHNCNCIICQGSSLSTLSAGLIPRSDVPH